jgi:hypothetical protein
MNIKVGQKIKVANIEKFKSKPSDYLITEAGIYKGNVLFRTEMFSKKEIIVKGLIPFKNDCFVGDDNWCWHDWMIELPKKNIPMETE